MFLTLVENKKQPHSKPYYLITLFVMPIKGLLLKEYHYHPKLTLNICLLEYE